MTSFFESFASASDPSVYSEGAPTGATQVIGGGKVEVTMTADGEFTTASGLVLNATATPPDGFGAVKLNYRTGGDVFAEWTVSLIAQRGGSVWEAKLVWNHWNTTLTLSTAGHGSSRERPPQRTDFWLGLVLDSVRGKARAEFWDVDPGADWPPQPGAETVDGLGDFAPGDPLTVSLSATIQEQPRVPGAPPKRRKSVLDLTDWRWASVPATEPHVSIQAGGHRAGLV